MNKQQALAFLEEHRQQFSKISDQIWDYAETAFEEYQSADCLCHALEEFGFQVERGIAGIQTAFCATYGSGGPVIGILGEYDALFQMSQTPGVPTKQEQKSGGSGHGCGHNMLGTASLAAAVAVKQYLEENNIPGTVKYFGCPGEEGGSGKTFMVREGAFEDVDIALTWHPSYANAVMDVSLLANYQIRYKFKGTASHAAATPHLGRSALDAVELMNVGVNFLREHIIPQARIHYAITDAGGMSPNVVQPKAEVLYLIRAPKTAQVEEIYQRVNKIAQGAAMMTETEVEIEFVKACSNIVPNKTLFAAMYQNMQEIGVPSYEPAEQMLAGQMAATLTPQTFDKSPLAALSAEDARAVMAQIQGKALCDFIAPFHKETPSKVLPGSSDVGDVSWVVPTGQIVTACYALGTPNHSWQLVSQGKNSVAHKGLLYAAKVIAGTAIDALTDESLIAAAKQELKQQLAGEEYICPIPKDVKAKPPGAGAVLE